MPGIEIDVGETVLTRASLALGEYKAQGSKLPDAVPVPTEDREIVMRGALGSLWGSSREDFLIGFRLRWSRDGLVARRFCLSW